MKRYNVIINVLAIIIIIVKFPMYTYALDFDVEDVYNAVFVVYSDNNLGSGFSIGKNCVITNAHVISNKENISVKTYDEKTYKAELVAINEEMDLAIISVNNIEFSSLEICTDAVLVGEDVFAIGVPSNLEYTLTKGIISSKNREIGNYSFIQANIALNSGNSGGPLLNSSGQVIGVNSMKLSDVEGIGFAIPMKTVIDYLNIIGIETNVNGNVEGTIDNNENEISNDKELNVSNYQTKKNEKYIIMGIIGVLIFSIIIVVLVYKANSTKKKKYDASERTDFEIDLED